MRKKKALHKRAVTMGLIVSMVLPSTSIFAESSAPSIQPASTSTTSNNNIATPTNINKEVQTVWDTTKVLTTKQLLNNQSADVIKNLETVGKAYLTQKVMGSLLSGTGITGNGGITNISTESLLGNVLNGGSLTGLQSTALNSILSGNASSPAQIATEVAASTGTEMLGNAVGNSALGSVMGSSNLGGSLLGSSIGGMTGDSGLGNAASAAISGNAGLGTLASLFAGNQLSPNASFSVEFTNSAHSAFIQGFASINPLNPIKHDSVNTKAWVTSLSLPATASVSWNSPPVLTDTSTFDTATPVGSVEEKRFVFAYTYQPPCIPTGNTCTYPPAQPGVVTITVRFKVSEFNALGGNSSSYNSIGGAPSMGSSGNFTPLSIASTPTSSSAPITTPSVGGVTQLPNFSGLTGAINDLMSNGIPYSAGVTNVSIPGIGNGLMSLSNSISGLFKDQLQSKDDKIKQAVADETASTQTPAEVREEHIQEMSSILNTAQEILKKKGIAINSVEDVKRLYDPDSPYTDPKVAWDFNRLTQFVK